MLQVILNYVVAMTSFIVVNLLLPASLTAQSIWIHEAQGQTITVEILKPKFNEHSFLGNTTFISSAVMFTWRFTVSEKLVLVGELPVAFGSRGADFHDSTPEVMIGNPYVGHELRKPNFPLYAEIGVRLPIAADLALASSVGTHSDVDRLEAFTPDILTLIANLNYLSKYASNFGLRLRSGTAVWIPTVDGADTEILFDYSAQIGYDSKRLSFVAGVTGRMLLTQKNLNIGERTFHQLGSSISLNLGFIQPGIHLRLPLDDDLKDVVDFVFGINLGFQINF